jgi:SAM-dependent methyltransferase
VNPERLRRQYVKLCDLRDFNDPTLRERIRDIVPGYDPAAELRRKFWEYAMLTLFLEDVGKLTDDTAALSVGAGHEEVLYWLANKLGRVVATDIYGEATFAESDDTMLSDPARYAPYPYREERLEVHNMDARSLGFDDEAFDFVFSLSSIEHFGSMKDVERGAREIGRVLRPGGYAFIVTECLLSPDRPMSRVVQNGLRLVTRARGRGSLSIFTARELESHVVLPSGLKLLQQLDTSVSPETWKNVIRWSGHGKYEPAGGEPWPHIILLPSLSAFSLRIEGAPFTSVALALGKPA